MTNRVYPIGYSAYGARERVDELVKLPNMLIVDTRKTPYSWRVDWREQELKKKYKDKYKQAGKYLGNEGYKSGYIKIIDPEQGIRGIIQYLSEGHDLILLCECASFDDCHLSVIVDLLEKKVKVEVVKFVQKMQPNILRCFSTRPPYGSWLANPQRFIDVGLPPKTIENRDKDFTDGYRGPVLIHQSKTFELGALNYWWAHMPGIERIFSLEEEGYPHGCFVGQADLVDVIEDSEDPWFMGDYGIVLANARPIDPIPYRGQLGLFSVERSMIEKFEPMRAQEPERMIVCRRSGPGKGCTMTWTPGDRCFLNNTAAIITETKMEGLTQLVRVKLAVDAPLLGRRLVSDHPKWLDGGLLKPRGTIIPELGESE